MFNAVTPNNDGKHDFLHIQNAEYFPGNKVIIYSKIGHKVWEVTDYINGDPDRSFWGYNDNNDELPDGTYYYLIKYKGDSEVSGFFLLSK